MQPRRQAVTTTMTGTMVESAGRKRGDGKRGRAGRIRRRVLQVLGFALGVALLVYPLLTDILYTYEASNAITTLKSEASSAEDDPRRRVQLVQAQAYNAVLAGRDPGMERAGILPYEKQLDWQVPYIGWLEIPVINVSLPVYHGTDEETLSGGAGHVEGTSLPVGGDPSNCCISAHSGLQTARMFDDLRRLQVGDKVCVHTLGDPYAYEVCGVETVLPEETDHLGIYSEDVADMLTLVTCTPIGVNDHRLLVHCKRIAYDPADFEQIPATAYLNTRTVPPLVAGIVLLAVSSASVYAGSRLRRRRRERAALEDAAMRMARENPLPKGKSGVRPVQVVGLVVGLAVLASPIALDAYSAWKAHQVITTLESRVDESDDPARLEQLVQARAYNDRLARVSYVEPEGGLWDYDDQLSWKGKPYMAYVDIPVAHVEMPIYHGTADAELAAGIGHLEGRSLPVGGETATCVLEGHSGMATSRMFDDIRLLEEGDMLCIWALAEPYAYKVTGWEIVEPDEVIPRLDIEPHVDRVVLVTCTTTPDILNPKGRTGVNDRRLLVYAERCEYDPAYFERGNPVSDVVTSPRSLPFAVALAAAISLTAVLAARGRRRRRCDAVRRFGDDVRGLDAE